MPVMLCGMRLQYGSPGSPSEFVFVFEDDTLCRPQTRNPSPRVTPITKFAQEPRFVTVSELLVASAP